MDKYIEVSVSGLDLSSGIYVVGYDTLGDGIVFDDYTQVCKNIDELNDEVARVISEHIEIDSELTIKEQLVIARIVSDDDYKLEVSEVTHTKTKRSIVKE